MPTFGRQRLTSLMLIFGASGSRRKESLLRLANIKIRGLGSRAPAGSGKQGSTVPEPGAIRARIPAAQDEVSKTGLKGNLTAMPPGSRSTWRSRQARRDICLGQRDRNLQGSGGAVMRRPDHDLDEGSHDDECGSPQASLLDEATGTKPSRRGLLRGTLASIAALVFARQTTQHADAQAAGSGTLVLLPAQVAADYMRQRLLPDPAFQTFYQHFTQQGFQFIPERVQLAMGVRPSQPGVPLPPSLPFLLAIVPSFRPVERSAPSHEAVSIVVLRERRVNSVLASTVTVSHQPFQIASFTVLELDRTGKLVSRSINRSQLTALSPDQLARVLGPPDLKPSPADGEVPVPTENDSLSLASLAYRNLLLDNFARPLYPPAGLQSMLADTSLVQKWTLVNRRRYQQGDSGLGFSLCSSSSSSCNGCSSSSSSTFGL
jgi:hypothetical protein